MKLHVEINENEIESRHGADDDRKRNGADAENKDAAVVLAGVAAAVADKTAVVVVAVVVVVDDSVTTDRNHNEVPRSVETRGNQQRRKTRKVQAIPCLPNSLLLRRILRSSPAIEIMSCGRGLEREIEGGLFFCKVFSFAQLMLFARKKNLIIFFSEMPTAHNK